MMRDDGRRDGGDNGERLQQMNKSSLHARAPYAAEFT
jgi:hypothetical protein